MTDQRSTSQHVRPYRSPEALSCGPALDRGACFESCMTPVMGSSWGLPSQPHLASSGRQDEATCDLYPDPEFQALISNTIRTPPRPLRSFDLLPSPASPGWLHNWSSSTIFSPFSPQQIPQEPASLPLGHQLHSFDSARASPMNCTRPQRPASIKRTYSASLPVHSPHTYSASWHPGSPDLCHPDLFVRDLDVGNALHVQQPSDSSLNCQTPVQQQHRQMSGSLSDSGLHLSHSMCEPVAASAAASAACTFASQGTRAPALRRSSARVPAKRSLASDFDFEVTQVVQQGSKTRSSRRGPTGPCKAMKSSCASYGDVKIEEEPSCASSICGLLSPFTLLKPFGNSGSSLEELNEKIQESARKTQFASSSEDSSNTGMRQSCSAGSVTMKTLPKGVPVGATSLPR